MQTIFTAILLACLSATVFICNKAFATDLVAGFNIVNPMRIKKAEREKFIEQLQKAGVQCVRCGVSDDDQGIGFAKQLQEHGIKLILNVGPEFPPDAPKRQVNADFPHLWSGSLLSSADPELSKASFQSMLGKLEEQGIDLLAIELGNEINGSGFNRDFPLPGSGSVFGLEDLYNDPVGKKIGQSYIKYISVLAALKEVRDHSKLYRRTPIISAGLACCGPPHRGNSQAPDNANIAASIQFMRANGLDKVVDGYGIHVYPWENTAAKRKKELLNDCSECHRGKPAWITEWGFKNKDTDCPVNDAERAALVSETMNNFREMASQGRLVGASYYCWLGDPWSKFDPYSVYRCGELTAAGKAVLAP